MFDEQALEQQHINDPTLNESPGDDDMETGDDMDRFDQNSANESSANEGPAEASAADMSAREPEWEQEANTQTNSDPDAIPGAPGKPEEPDLPGTPDAPALAEGPPQEPAS